MSLAGSDYRLVSKIRSRERDRGRVLPGDDDLYADAQSAVPGWGPMHGFYEFFLGGEASSVALPSQVVSEGCFDMYEAAREAGMASLTEFARQAAPVASALVAFGADHDRTANSHV